MNDFIAWGGNNYPDLREKKYKIRQGMQISINGNFHILLSLMRVMYRLTSKLLSTLGPLDVDVAEQYVKLKTPIHIQEEGRIEIVTSPKCQNGEY